MLDTGNTGRWPIRLLRRCDRLQRRPHLAFSTLVPFDTLVYINAGTTLLVVPLALVLPRVLVNDHDNAGSAD